MKEYIVGEGSYAYEMRRYEELKELIRCKDCKWYYRGGATCMYWDGENSMRGDDFCSRGRKERQW